MRNEALEKVQNEIRQVENKIKKLNDELKKLHKQEAVEKYSKLFPVGKRINLSDKTFEVVDHVHMYGFPTLRVRRVNKDGTLHKLFQDLFSYSMDDLYKEAVNETDSKNR